MEFRGHVLLVDDEAMVRDSLSEWLQMEGYSVTTAAGGEEALQLCKMFPFDVGVFDIRMPGMDGLTLLAKVKEGWSKIDVVMITAYGTIESAVDCIQKGAFDYIIKPFPPEKLSLLIGQIRRTQILQQSDQHLKKQLATHQEFLSHFRNFLNLGIYLDQTRPDGNRVWPLLPKGDDENCKAVFLTDLAATVTLSSNVSIQISPSLPAVLADRASLIWALENCLDNAYRAIHAAGIIVISAELLSPRKISLSIIDNGCGLASPERLFEPFHSAWKQEAGQGLGLWVARHLLQSMNGTLEVKTNKSGQTQATFLLTVFMPPA
jgi:CheY-like chemotaxis protein